MVITKKHVSTAGVMGGKEGRWASRAREFATFTCQKAKAFPASAHVGVRTTYIKVSGVDTYPFSRVGNHMQRRSSRRFEAFGIRRDVS